MDTSTAQADLRTCDYCDQPADGIMSRLVPRDRATKRVSFGRAHDNCLKLHYDAIDDLNTPSASIKAGVLR